MCTVTEFRCDSGLCIDLSQRCDGQIDCPGGIDEFRCGGNDTSVTMDTVAMNNVTLFLCATNSSRNVTFTVHYYLFMYHTEWL